MTELRTERLILRRARPEDAAALFAVFSDDRAMRYWSHLPHRHPDQTAHWIAGLIAADPAVCDDFIVVRDGRPIGKCGVWHMPEIGLILHPDHWHQGLGREALIAAIDHIFGTRDLPAITADIDPDNTASLALFEGLGFRRTGYEKNTVQLGDRWCHSVYLALSGKDWTARGQDASGPGLPKK